VTVAGRVSIHIAQIVEAAFGSPHCVVPRAARFLAYLRQYARIADPVPLKQDFTRLQSLSHEEQQKQLRDLAVRDEIIAAIYIARKLYGFSMLQAKTIVDGLTNGQQPT
jgi:hypothetical protein